jgi:hypothetical protein
MLLVLQVFAIEVVVGTILIVAVKLVNVRVVVLVEVVCTYHLLVN